MRRGTPEEVASNAVFLRLFIKSEKLHPDCALLLGEIASWLERSAGSPHQRDTCLHAALALEDLAHNEQARWPPDPWQYPPMRCVTAWREAGMIGPYENPFTGRKAEGYH